MDGIVGMGGLVLCLCVFDISTGDLRLPKSGFIWMSS